MRRSADQGRQDGTERAAPRGASQRKRMLINSRRPKKCGHDNSAARTSAISKGLLKYVRNRFQVRQRGALSELNRTFVLYVCLGGGVLITRRTRRKSQKGLNSSPERARAPRPARADRCGGGPRRGHAHGIAAILNGVDVSGLAHPNQAPAEPPTERGSLPPGSALPPSARCRRSRNRRTCSA